MMASPAISDQEASKEICDTDLVVENDVHPELNTCRKVWFARLRKQTAL